jgi:signal transduction histidine kinase
MNPRIRSRRLPLFELSMLFVLGWAGLEAYKLWLRYSTIEQRWKQEFRQAEQDWKQEFRQAEQDWKRYVLDVRTLYTAVFEAQHTVKLRETYDSLAARLRVDVPEMHRALTNAVLGQATNDIARFELRSHELRDWLRQYELRVQSDMLAGKSLELQDKLSQAISGPEQLPVLADLGRLLEQVDLSLTNYIAKAERLLLLAGHGLEGHPTGNYVAKLERDQQRLLDLAEQSRRSGMAVEKFARLPISLGEGMADFPQHQPSTNSLAGLTIGDNAEDVRTLLHTIVGVWVILLIFSLGAVYRSMVVAPLREKLSASHSVIEHESKLAHLGQLLASLAHEIRNPLTAINARLYTLQKSVAEGTPEHKDALVIRSEINRLDHIVKDYLKLTRPADPRFAALKAEDIYQELHDLLEPDLSQQGVELKIGDATSVPFRADPQQIKQVLINLIQNAAEAIGHEGTITLSARRDSVRLKGQHDSSVILEVGDTGPGIPRDVQEKLFDPFFSTKENGTGLGLAISAQIVEKHGGAIEFDTEPGHGTTFRLVLPAANGKQL